MSLDVIIVGEDTSRDHKGRISFVARSGKEFGRGYEKPKFTGIRIHDSNNERILERYSEILKDTLDYSVTSQADRVDVVAFLSENKIFFGGSFSQKRHDFFDTHSKTQDVVHGENRVDFKVNSLSDLSEVQADDEDFNAVQLGPRFVFDYFITSKLVENPNLQSVTLKEFEDAMVDRLGIDTASFEDEKKKMKLKESAKRGKK